MEAGVLKVKNRNVPLDVLKLVASYMVVFIHFKFDGEVGFIVDALARFAVPVFFMTSGYFACGNSVDQLKAKIRDIVGIYLTGAVLYFCFYFALRWYDAGLKSALWYCVSYLNVTHIAKFLIFNVPRSAEHLWFLLALIYVYGMYCFITKQKIKERVYLCVAVFLLIAHYVLGVGLSAFGVVTPICVVRNFLLMGYPFFCIGIVLRKKETAIVQKFTCAGTATMLIVGVVTTIASYFVCGANELYIGSTMIACALFIIVLKMKNTQLDEKIIKLCRYSADVYLIHILIGNCLERIVATEAVAWKIAFPVLVCVISTFAGALMKKVEYKFGKNMAQQA